MADMRLMNLKDVSPLVIGNGADIVISDLTNNHFSSIERMGSDNSIKFGDNLSK